jgi:hypothetical protein
MFKTRRLNVGGESDEEDESGESDKAVEVGEGSPAKRSKQK